MKIEAGKYYKIRGGGQAHILGVREDGVGDYQAVGYIVGDMDNSAEAWTMEGRYFSGVGESSVDLIEEWKEPKRGTVWVNVYPGPCWDVYPHKIEADCGALSSRLACIRVDWVEGQFDE